MCPNAPKFNPLRNEAMTMIFQRQFTWFENKYYNFRRHETNAKIDRWD